MDSSWWKWVAAGATSVGILALRRYFGGIRCLDIPSLAGKTIVITGANTGLGKATALELAKRNAKVILACRDQEKGEAALKDIRKRTQGGKLKVKSLDLGSLVSIKTFVSEMSKEENKIDILINNAGVFQCPFSKTQDGFETQMGVNHLGHFYLTNLLLGMVKKSDEGRIIIVSSSLAKRGNIDFENLNSEKSYDKRKAYSNSKLANNYFARELGKKLQDTSINVYCLHPGMVFTDLGRHVWPSAPWKWILFPIGWLLIKTPYQGSQTIIHCAIAQNQNGRVGYYGNCKEEPWPENCLDEGIAKKLWEESERLTGLA